MDWSVGPVGQPPTSQINSTRQRILRAMKLDIPDEYIPLIVDALEHKFAYTRAAQREDGRYQQAAEWFKRKQPTNEEPERPTKRKRA